jgi:hypothetical protein
MSLMQLNLKSYAMFHLSSRVLPYCVIPMLMKLIFRFIGILEEYSHPYIDSQSSLLQMHIDIDRTCLILPFKF